MEAVARQLHFRRTLIAIGVIVSFLLTAGLLAGRRAPDFQADGLPTVTPKAAQDFVRSIGVTTHLTHTDYTSNAHFADVFTSVVKPKLRELGLYYVRQYPGEVDSSFPTFVAKYNELSNPPAGYPKIAFSFETHVDPTVSSNPQNSCYLPKMKYILNGTVGNCNGLQNYTTPSSVSASGVENPNEPDHCASWICGQATVGTWFQNSLSQNPNWPDDVLLAAQAAQTKLSGDPLTASLDRLAPAFVWLPYHQNETYNGVNLATYLAPLKNYITHGNVHPYCNLQSVSACFSSQVQPAVSYYAPRPVIVTETGHSTGEFTEKQQAKYLIRILFDFFERGIPKTYIYELLDEPTASTTKEKNFGLINEDGREKPAFAWLKNTLSLLKDTGAPRLDALPLSITGTGIRSTLLRKSDSSYWLALQYDKSNTVDTDVTSPATITFASPKNISYYNTESTEAYSSTASTSSVTFPVADRVVLLKITEPASASTSSDNSSTTKKSENKNSTTQTTEGTASSPPPTDSPAEEAPLNTTLEPLSQRFRNDPVFTWILGITLIALLGVSYLIVRFRRSR